MQQIVLSSRQFPIHWIRTTKRCPVTKQLALICAMCTAINPLYNHRDNNFQCHTKQIPWNGNPEISHSEAHRLEYKTETLTKTQTDNLIAIVLAKKEPRQHLPFASILCIDPVFLESSMTFLGFPRNSEIQALHWTMFTWKSWNFLTNATGLKT